MTTNKCDILNDVQQLENRVECLARIDNYWKLLQRVTVGEFVTSELIDLNFTESVGASKWMLIIYPKGQYNQYGIANGHVSVYLRMVSCDNKDKSLMVKVRVFFKSPYFQMKDECVCMKNATLLYGDVLKLCVGPFELVRLKELYSSQSQNLFLTGTLTIGCELVVISLSPRYIKLNEFYNENQTDVRSRYKQTNVMESQLKSYDNKSKSHTSIQLDGKYSSYKLMEKKPQDLRTWGEKFSKKSKDDVSNVGNTPPNDQCNIQSKITKMSKDTGDSVEITPPKVYKLIEHFEKMCKSMSRPNRMSNSSLH